MVTPYQPDTESEGYNLAFYRDDGYVLEHLQFDTLETALDQAKAIEGIQPSERHV